jgi:acyl-CoA reductase-like NAD-dependent aldehyde dehydrogenase
MSEQTLQIQAGQLFIGGEWQAAASGDTFETLNPATAQPLAQVASAAEADVDRAVRAARDAFENGPWPGMDARARGRLLHKIADGLEARADELARMEAMDNGKPVREARMIDIKESIDCFRYYAGWADKISGDVIPVPGPYLNYTRREPMGVCGAIIPWNYPLQMAAWKVAPAIACGNTMVLKPAEQTPLTALELARVAAEAGLPAGVLNVVTGFGESAGAALVRHPDVDKIAFTGSTEVGKIIQREAAGSLKRVSLELGGKSPNIVLDDADVDAAVRGATMAIFYNAGQACTAGSRLLVAESIRDQFVEKLVQRAASMKAGDPLDPKTRLGPLVSQEQLDRVLGYVQKGKDEGAELLTGGERVEVNGMQGYFLNPTIFDRVTPEMTIAREEIFGPVLGITTFKDMDEAIHIANSSIYGLAAAVWTQNIKKAHQAAHRLRAGTVWVNTYHNLDTASPFGGYKQSGYGRELGKYALDLYTQVKSVWINLG